MHAVFSDPEEDPGDPGDPGPVTLDGTWPLERALASAEPIAPRTAPCTEGYTTGFQPSKMTIVGDVVGTDYGSMLANVTFGGAHDLSFDLSEYWNTVGWNQPHPIHYELDQTASDTLTGTVTAMPPWPNGACAYTFLIISKRE